jgi:hypothetical protein
LRGERKSTSLPANVLIAAAAVGHRAGEGQEHGVKTSPSQPPVPPASWREGTEISRPGVERPTAPLDVRRAASTFCTFLFAIRHARVEMGLAIRRMEMGHRIAL